MAFTEIDSFVKANDFKKVRQYCENLEIEGRVHSKHQLDTIKSYYGIYMLTLLIENDIVNAKLLYKRIPQDFKNSNQPLKNIWNIVKSISQSDSTSTYKALSEGLGDDYAPLLNTLKKLYQSRTFNLISDAYSSITVNDCSSFLGLSNDDTISFTTSKGWTFDKESNTLKPIPIPKISSASPSGNEQIKSLADYVLFLEK
ncbi:hypothetical protein DICPUDRAFT_160083 [Dictyostelium purpureum]|uniref:CSN8/PSMD8/EIF3K domain-containing protein n=1 Tax=Dictyostelium purpureum TaxID=5786 RepID=F1A5N9_DICPU|nr:uncharacterized protein DICPUDRAFT_160083 [Dictyostelium purpureum]EGC28488.1 hypothetical protein DICPUDRAFT_160083 [Dictyostelium purpureum]|eukprot:XP_003294983.1 hypothetical protein DICPUDRAFT_160083 [Dictyostelium purpureum]